jgi:hypothetical protein
LFLVSDPYCHDEDPKIFNLLYAIINTTLNNQKEVKESKDEDISLKLLKISLRILKMNLYSFLSSKIPLNTHFQHYGMSLNKA